VMPRQLPDGRWVQRKVVDNPPALLIGKRVEDAVELR